MSVSLEIGCSGGRMAIFFIVHSGYSREAAPMMPRS